MENLIKISKDISEEYKKVVLKNYEFGKNDSVYIDLKNRYLYSKIYRTVKVDKDYIYLSEAFVYDFRSIVLQGEFIVPVLLCNDSKGYYYHDQTFFGDYIKEDLDLIIKEFNKKKVKQISIFDL